MWYNDRVGSRAVCWNCNRYLLMSLRSCNIFRPSDPAHVHARHLDLPQKTATIVDLEECALATEEIYYFDEQRKSFELLLTFLERRDEWSWTRGGETKWLSQGRNVDMVISEKILQ